MPVIRIYLPARPASVQEARDRLRPLLNSWPNEAARYNAVLLLSEVVTNAVRHALGETILITLTTMDHHLRAEVHDESAIMPIPRPSDETGGRGLVLIDQLSVRWGVDQHQGAGKTVWFEMDNTQPGRARES